MFIPMLMMSSTCDITGYHCDIIWSVMLLVVQWLLNHLSSTQQYVHLVTTQQYVHLVTSLILQCQTLTESTSVPATGEMSCLWSSRGQTTFMAQPSHSLWLEYLWHIWHLLPVMPDFSLNIYRDPKDTKCSVQEFQQSTCIIVWFFGWLHCSWLVCYISMFQYHMGKAIVYNIFPCDVSMFQCGKLLCTTSFHVMSPCFNVWKAIVYNIFVCDVSMFQCVESYCVQHLCM